MEAHQILNEHGKVVLDGVNVTWPFAPKHLNPSMNANTYVGSVATSGFDSDRPAGCVAELGTDEVQLNMHCATEGKCLYGHLPVNSEVLIENDRT